MGRPDMTILDQLIAGTIDPKKFSHADHIVVAHAALERFEFFDAVRVIGDGLRALTIRVGVPEKYNATVTFAFMSIIAERMAETACTGIDDFLRRNPDLFDPSIFHRWYSQGRMSSDLARAVALMPDKAPD